SYQKKFGNIFNRGPNGENPNYFPESVEDPIPFREVEGKISYGMNLDGTTDGRATPRSCKHQKFTSPDGAEAVDNQLYRALGCSKTYRKSGFVHEVVIQEFEIQSQNRMLIEIT